MRRCDECLDEIPDAAPRFAVYEEEKPYPVDDYRLWQPRVIEAMVCEDCSGWHRDAVEITVEA